MKEMAIKRETVWYASCLLVVVMLMPWDGVSGAAREIWSSARFPTEKLGPDNWRYYRGVLNHLPTEETSPPGYKSSKLRALTVELPLAFSFFTVSLTRHWPHDDKESSTVGTVPLVCFGFNGPPLTAPPRECGWFNDTVVIEVTNEEVVSGALYIGIFGDSKSTRTQSKMIPRPQRYLFEVRIQVFRCASEGLGGRECNLRIRSLPPAVFSRSLHLISSLLDDNQYFSSPRASRELFEKKVAADHLSLDHKTYQERPPSFGLLDLEAKSKIIDERHGIITRNQFEDKKSIGEANVRVSDWVSPSQECVRLDDKQFFTIQLVDFVQVLEIKYECTSSVFHGVSKCEEFESMIKEERVPLLHLRYGALPGKYTSDFVGEPSTGTISVPGPKRGWWYLAIFNPMFAAAGEAKWEREEAAKNEMCFTLKWRARTCSPGLIGDDCQWSLLHLERILKTEVESPFDSYYAPASDPDYSNDGVEWFSLESLSNASASDVTVEQWGFAMLQVSKGASGAVLSFDVKDEDVKHLLKKRSETQELGENLNGLQSGRHPGYQSLSFSVIYPVEGYWCLGLRYVPNKVTLRESSLKHTPDMDGEIVERLNRNWISKWKPYFVCYKGKLSFLRKVFSSHGTSTVCEESSLDGSGLSQANISSEGKIKVRVTLHGCPNQCSGHGNCQTAYEASRLHVVSYCHCDVTHGDFDCSALLLGPWDDLRQRSLLIFSNAAAIFPSMWALRHQAFSEWVIFTLSGTASAIYHSCDAGGWCAMSFSTLQFLDFWLSFLAIIMTCLYMAGFAGSTKAMLHVVSAVLTAAMAEEDATSGWSVLLVVLISSTGLLLGWGLETQKVSSLLSWHYSTNRLFGPVLQLCHRWAHSFYVQLRDRFHWPYLFLGLGILLSALVSNRMELPETYWMTHSWWHIGMYTAAYVLLHSTKIVERSSPDRGRGAQYADTHRYQNVAVRDIEGSSITDSHDALISELDTLPESRSL